MSTGIEFFTEDTVIAWGKIAPFVNEFGRCRFWRGFITGIGVASIAVFIAMIVI